MSDLSPIGGRVDYQGTWGGMMVQDGRRIARFQSVPDWYELPDKRTLAARVIGNMVPPLVMQRIAEGMLA